MVYAAAAQHYLDAGWRCVLPIPPATKTPPPDGYTGEHGADEIPPDVLAHWLASYPAYSIALRLPAGVIALDIDHYTKGEVTKRGADTITALETELGPLPTTWASTARGNDMGAGESRTLFYRVPPGRYRSNLGAGAAVEVLQRHHRYALVWPSSNPDHKAALYRWYEPSGQVSTGIPHADQLPELPDKWVEYLTEGASSATGPPASGADALALLAALQRDDRGACAEITNAHQQAQTDFAAATTGSRHDVATGRAYQLIRLGGYGHTGVGAVLVELTGTWCELTTGEGREDEWLRICLSAAAKVASELGACTPVHRDPCAMISHWGPPVPVTTDPEAPDEGPVLEVPAPAPPIIWSRRELIGTHSFDPAGALDQLLADEVLGRIRPVLRYATDSGQWVLRGPYNWTASTDLAEWAVSELAYLMPRGNPEADKGTAQWWQAERRRRFLTNGTANAIASKMRAVVRAAGHPCAVQLAELDADPEILWAGGLPWSLRSSLERPALALVDTATPHLESAGVAPSGFGVEAPTPVWDAYLAAVWPDPEVREYALQVLSIGLTGYSDAALPILLGDTGRGKSSLCTLLMSLLGGYAHAADPRLLTSADNSHASIVYALKGKRWSFIDEGPREGRLATERLKQLTGGAELTGNAMRANPVTFAPTHTLVLTANEAPTFGDPALRRRVRLIPCDGDPGAVATTRAAITPAVWWNEAPGVLAAMMHRSALWLSDRSVAGREAAPLTIRYATEEIAHEQDLTRAWIEAEMEPHPDGTRATELLASYADWLRRLSIKPPTPSAFGRKLAELGYPAIHQRDGKFRPLRRRQGQAFGPPVPPPTSHGVSEPTPADAEPPTASCGSSEPPPVPPVSPQTDTNRASYGQTADAENIADLSASVSAFAEDVHSNEKTTSQSDELASIRSSQDQMSEMSKPEDSPSSSIVEHVSEPTGRSTVTGDGLVTACERKGSQDQQHLDQLLLVVGDGLTGYFTYNDSRDNNQDHILSIGGNREITRHPSQDPLAEAVPATLSVTGLCDGFERGDHDVAASPRTEQQAAQQLAERRARRNELTKAHKKAVTADQADVPVLAILLEAARAAVREAEKSLRGIRAELSRAAAVADAAGAELVLPAAKIRGVPAYSVDLTTAAVMVRTAIERDAGRCTVDIENTGYPIGHPDHAVRTVQLGDDQAAVVFDVADPVQFAVAALLLAEAPALQAFSAAVEISHLAHIGMIDYQNGWERVHDVVIKAQLYNPIGTLSSEQGLKSQAEMHLPDPACVAADAGRATLFRAGGWLTDTKIKNSGSSESAGWIACERNGWARVSPRCATMVDYAASDVLDTADLAHRLPAVPEPVYGRERAIQAAVGAVSLHGLRLDADHIDAKIAYHEPARELARVALTRYAIDNPASSDQVAAALIARGAVPGVDLPLGEKSGKPSTKAVVLRNLPRTEHLAPLVDQVLAFRHHQRVLTTYLGPYQLLCRHGDGRLRTTIYTLQADTGRFSSVHENLQNIPRTGGIRECVIADEGWEFIDADLSGVEVAVLAALSQDAALLELVASGRKLHKIIAEQVYGPNYLPEQYNYVKNGVFAKLYGAGIIRIADTVGCSEAEAQRMVTVLDEIAPGVKQWGYDMRNRAAAGMHSVQLYSGRVLHLPASTPHKIVNYLVQGTARDIYADGLLRWHASRWGKLPRALIVPIHDETLGMVPRGEGREAQVHLVECMATELYGVKIGADPKWKDSNGVPVPSLRWLGNDAKEAA